MAASLTALATVIWSDFAQASQQPQVELSDELIAPPPVKTSKIEHTPDPFEEVLLRLEKPRPSKRSSRFGSFEGY